MKLYNVQIETINTDTILENYICKGKPKLRNGYIRIKDSDSNGTYNYPISNIIYWKYWVDEDD